MQWFSCDTWHWRPLTKWWFQKKKKKNKREKKKKWKKRTWNGAETLLFFLFFTTLSPPPFFPEGPSSARLRARHPFWNMQIADSAFACWCLTFPLEVAHRLNYAPLSAVCLKTPVILPQSATLRQSHFSTSPPPRVCLEAVWTRWGRLPRGGWLEGNDEEGGGVEGVGNEWWGSLTSAAAPRFYCGPSRKTVCVNIIFYKWRLQGVGDLPPFSRCRIGEGTFLSLLWGVCCALLIHTEISRKQLRDFFFFLIYYYFLN